MLLRDTYNDNKIILKFIPVIPEGGITTLPNSPCRANNCRISCAGVAAGKFFTNIVVFDRSLDGWKKCTH